MADAEGSRRVPSAAAVRVLLGAGVAGAAGLEVARRVVVARRRARDPEQDSAESQAADDPWAPRLRDAFPEAVEAGRALRDAGLSVAVAESCTGGLLGAALTAIPGSSAYVRGGVIAYADDVKRDLLGVPAAVLAEHGAVSEETAVAMAEGVRAALNASVGVSITGIAGPASDETDKPVGLVYVCVVGPAMERRIEVLHRDRGREGNRAEAVRRALRLATAAAAGTPAG
jgi:PncC family amidohydrolase